MREFGNCTWLRVDDLEEEIEGERCKATRLHSLIVSLESLSLTLLLVSIFSDIFDQKSIVPCIAMS